MEHLTKQQVVLLVLLVSFFTSLVTGIVTVTLMEQIPDPVVQNINRIVKNVVPVESPSQNQQATVQTVIVTQEDLVVEIVNDVSPAVVSVVASKDVPVIEQFFINPFENDNLFQGLPEEFLPDVQVPQYRQKGTEKKQVSSGTGFFVSDKGLLITNKHVVEDTEAEYSVVLNDGRTFDAEVLARDPLQDIAILKINSEEELTFKYIPLGNSNRVKAGQTVIAVGNALGKFQNSVSIGIISGLNRNIVAQGAFGSEALQEVIQTDAAINRGNSGGPLVDLEGNVVGINTAMASGAENVGFALPINIAKKGINDVKEFGKIVYPFLGIRYIIIDDNIKEEKGLSVNYGILLGKGSNNEPAIIKDSPADKVGLEEGDIILEFDGMKLEGNTSFGKLIGNKRVGEKINLKILRGDEEKNIEATLEERPDNI